MRPVSFSPFHEPDRDSVNLLRNYSRSLSLFLFLTRFRSLFRHSYTPLSSHKVLPPLLFLIYPSLLHLAHISHALLVVPHLSVYARLFTPQPLPPRRRVYNTRPYKRFSVRDTPNLLGIILYMYRICEKFEHETSMFINQVSDNFILAVSCRS